MTGFVKYFRKDKGYGFIVSPEHEGDLFVHYSDIAGRGYRELNEGDRVDFDLVDNEQKPGKKKATNVRPSLAAAKEAARK